MSIIVNTRSRGTYTALDGRRRYAQTEPNGQSHTASTGRAVDEVRLWGLSVQELHDAFWKSRGVQCLRMGQAVPLEGADLYLLLRSRQLAIFDLESLLNQLTWQGACITAVHIVDNAADYYEAAITDEAGNIQRIERRYGTTTKPRGRVHLTGRGGLATQWMTATSSCAWRRTMQNTFPEPLVARLVSPGRCYVEDNASHVAQLLSELVERWHDPERVLEGLEVLHNGVRIRRGDHHPTIPIVGPIWIGSRNKVAEDTPCVVGPAWLPDKQCEAEDPRIVRVRQLHEIEAPESTGSTRCEQRIDVHSLYPVVKRIFDVSVSAIVLLALLPVFAIVAAAIVIDDGFPVLFRHRRQSRFGKSFNCLKFRTMCKNAERMVVDLSARNLCDGPQVHIQDDPRVTRIGHMLRKMHLDELPQFWNVLTGDMSLVGPRPSPDSENRICPAWRELRLSVRPGITGLWQVKRTRKPGRDFQEWIRYDVEYVHRAGFWLDLRICLDTASMILSGRRSK